MHCIRKADTYNVTTSARPGCGGARCLGQHRAVEDAQETPVPQTSSCRPKDIYSRNQKEEPVRHLG